MTARPALDVLAELNRGRFSIEMTEKLAELIEACADTGKKGDFVVKLTITPEKVNDYETPRITVSHQVATKKPSRDARPAVFFLDDTNRPVRTDPNQEAFGGIAGVPSQTEVTTDTRKAN